MLMYLLSGIFISIQRVKQVIRCLLLAGDIFNVAVNLLREKKYVNASCFICSLRKQMACLTVLDRVN